MKAAELQKRIDKTEYHDMRILDLQISFFGDEVSMIIDDDHDDCWEITFLSCHKVSYETDITRRNIDHVKEMKKPQLGYFGQKILVEHSELEDFYNITIDLSIMEMIIVCKDVCVIKKPQKELTFFWECYAV